MHMWKESKEHYGVRVKVASAMSPPFRQLQLRRGPAKMEHVCIV